MRAWKLVEEPVVGHWTSVGSSEDLLACRSDWVPVVDRNGLPLCLPVAPLGAYSTVQLPGCGYKELFHRQLLQDLLGRQLPGNVDVHNRVSSPAAAQGQRYSPGQASKQPLGHVCHSIAMNILELIPE